MELDELQKSYLELQDNFKKVSEEKTSLEKRVEDIEKEKTELQQTNHNLFLRVTSPQKQEEKSEKEKVSLEDIAEQYKKEKNIL